MQIILFQEIATLNMCILKLCTYFAIFNSLEDSPEREKIILNPGIHASPRYLHYNVIHIISKKIFSFLRKGVM